MITQNVTDSTTQMYRKLVIAIWHHADCELAIKNFGWNHHLYLYKPWWDCDDVFSLYLHNIHKSICNSVNHFNKRPNGKVSSGLSKTKNTRLHCVIEFWVFSLKLNLKIIQNAKCKVFSKLLKIIFITYIGLLEK